MRGNFQARQGPEGLSRGQFDGGYVGGGRTRRPVAISHSPGFTASSRAEVFSGLRYEGRSTKHIRGSCMGMGGTVPSTPTRYEGHRTKYTRRHDYRRHGAPHTRQTGSALYVQAGAYAWATRIFWDTRGQREPVEAGFFETRTETLPLACDVSADRAPLRDDTRREFFSVFISLRTRLQTHGFIYLNSESAKPNGRLAALSNIPSVRTCSAPRKAGFLGLGVPRDDPPKLGNKKKTGFWRFLQGRTREKFSRAENFCNTR